MMSGGCGELRCQYVYNGTSCYHRIRANVLQHTDIRISEDAGRYLCDFIYFSSLAHLAKREEEKRVVFLHVPVEADEAALKTGIEVTIELIRALVQSGRMKKLATGP